MTILFRIAISWLIGSASLHATDRFVAPPPLGSDTNPGTQAQPYATINRGAAEAMAGETVWIAPGIYQPTSPILPANSGTEFAPITYRAQSGGPVIIDGQTTVPTIASREGLFYISGKSWIVVDGLRIINSGFFGFLAKNGSSNITIRNCSTFFTYASGICAANSSNITVLNNSVQQACMAPPASPATGTSECITMASVNTFEVAYNTVFDRLTDPNNGGEGIDAKNACVNGSIHHNLVYDLYRVGIYVDAYSNNLSNVDVHSNTIYNCGGGITVASEVGATADGVRIHDNVVRDCRRGVGIRLAGYLDNGPLQNVDVYQNTVVRCGKTDSGSNWEDCALLVEADNPLNSNLNVRNNIFSQNNTNTPFIRTKNQSSLTLDRNLLDGTATSGVTGTNAIIGDALFVDTAANDFRLTSASPAIDAALGTPLSTLDHDGNPRTGPGDLGAFEWSEISQVTATSLTSTANPAPATGVVTFTATVTANSGIPGGTVTFYDGAVPLGLNTLGASGTTTLTTSVLGVGSHSITGIFAPASGNFAASTSPPLVQVITSSPLAPWIRACFTDGTGTSLPDQYSGSAGEGWLGAWSSFFGGAAVQSSNPLVAGSGNHLRATRSSGSGSTSQGGVCRQWDAAVRPENQFSRLTFDFRIDSDASFDTAGDAYTITLGSVTGTLPGGNSTAYLRCFGGSPGNDFNGNPIEPRKWYVFKGTPGVTDGYSPGRFLPTGISAAPGVTCSFTIDVYAASGPGTTNGKTHGTYDVTVTNGTETFSVPGSGFRSNLYTSGSFLAFATQQNGSADALAFSVDSINLAPQNTAPAVAAGSDQTITLPATADLSGTAEDDGLPVPGALVTTWSKLSGPGSVTFGNPSVLTTTATFSSAGTYVLRLTGIDGSLSISDDLTINVLLPEIIALHTAWRMANFTPAQLADPGQEATVWGNFADPDADGSNNLLEYAFGTDPNLNGSVIRPVPGIDSNGRLTLTFPRIADPSLTYEVFGSGALSAWESVWASTGAQNIPGNVTVTDTAPLPQNQRFLRLHSTIPPN